MAIKYTKLPLNYPVAIKYIKWAKYIPNGHNTYQTSFTARDSKIYPNLNFWFENIPSGNPGVSWTAAVQLLDSHSFSFVQIQLDSRDLLRLDL
jgi:hypothetical protein